MRETRNLPETRVLQDEVIASLSEGESESGSGADQLFAGQLSGPLQKALQALKTLRALADRDVNAQESRVDTSTGQSPLPSTRPNGTTGDEPGLTEQDK